MKLETRRDFGWPATSARSAPCDQGLVVHYDGSNQGLASKDHSACRAYWKSTRTFHMKSHGWLDIGYSYGVCPHGVVFEGRGWAREQAAQPGGNTTWTSVTFMSGPAEDPTPAQIEAFKELRAWLRGRGLGSGIRGHRDFVSTSCPGDRLYRLVKSGALGASPSGSPTPSTGGSGKGTEGVNPVIGLKKGDSGERVKALQALLEYAGFGKHLGAAGVDGVYGPATAEALRQARKSVGSEAKSGYGDKVTGWAYAQLMVAVARKQGKK